MSITPGLILVPTIWSLLCHIVSYGLQLDKSCLVMSCQIKQARLCRLCHCHTYLIIKRAGCQVLDVLWGFGWGGGSGCWGSLSCNLPVFSLENGLFYMFYSLLKHTISTHFRQFEMQKRSEPHLNCFDDLSARKKQPLISGIIFSFFLIFCHGSSVLLGVLAGKSEFCFQISFWPLFRFSPMWHTSSGVGDFFGGENLFPDYFWIFRRWLISSGGGDFFGGENLSLAAWVLLDFVQEINNSTYLKFLLVL